MKIDLEKSAANAIIAYESGSVHVHGSVHTSEGMAPRIHILTTSAIVTPDAIIEPWGPSTLSELTTAHMQAVLEIQPEIVILGTGRQLHFPAGEISHACYAAGIGLEIMDTGAACRTYNILAMEGRRVAAALLMIETAEEV